MNDHIHLQTVPCAFSAYMLEQRDWSWRFKKEHHFDAVIRDKSGLTL